MAMPYPVRRPGESPLPNEIVSVSDSTGMDGYNPAGAQSIYTDSISWYAAAYSRGALKIGSSCSVGGWTTSDVDAHWSRRVADPMIKFVLLGIGLNNIYGASDAGVAQVEISLRAWYEARAHQVLSWGGTPIVQTIFPAPAGYFAASSAKRLAAFRHNQWRRQFAFENGLPILDVESLVVDPANANGDPYSAYFEPGSPHPGKEIIRQLGKNLWDSIKHLTGPIGFHVPAHRYASHEIFTNSALLGTGGNLQTANVASVLPDDVWAWETGSHSTYSVQTASDSKLSFAGAPVMSNWVNVSTDVSGLSTAPGGSPYSASHPGMLFIKTGLSLSAGDVIRGSVEVDVVTPNTLVGFTCSLQDGGGGASFISPSGDSAFSPPTNADNAKNQILTASTFVIPEIEITLGAPSTSIWMILTPNFSGVSGASGAAVWRARSPRVWKAI